MTPAAPKAKTAADFIAASTPGGIEAMEAEGQRKLVSHPDRLPIRGTEGYREKWEALGFVFGEAIQEPNGSIFIACTFPVGWKMERTDQSMWSKVVDETGKERALVFFKAAFYDYKAHVDLVK